jgi:hypothetical protein
MEACQPCADERAVDHVDVRLAVGTAAIRQFVDQLLAVVHQVILAKGGPQLRSHFGLRSESMTAAFSVSALMKKSRDRAEALSVQSDCRITSVPNLSKAACHLSGAAQ